MDFLPIATIVAILIFITKECIEMFKRRAERMRKVGAIKELLQHEIAANYLVLQNLFCSLSSTERTEIEKGCSDAIIVQHGGRLRYNRISPKGEVVGGNPLPAVRVTEYNRLIPTLAELNKKLYAQIRSGYEHIYETEHLWNSFVDYLNGNSEEREMWFDGFRDYANRRYDNINEGIRKLYKDLSGKELPTKGARGKSRSAESELKKN